MARNAVRRVRIDPLVTYLTIYYEPEPYDGHHPLDAHSVVALAKLCGVGRHQIYRWREAGGVPWYVADAIAIELGTHPMLIWGDEWLALADAVA